MYISEWNSWISLPHTIHACFSYVYRFHSLMGKSELFIAKYVVYLIHPMSLLIYLVKMFFSLSRLFSVSLTLSFCLSFFHSSISYINRMWNCIAGGYAHWRLFQLVQLYIEYKYNEWQTIRTRETRVSNWLWVHHSTHSMYIHIYL